MISVSHAFGLCGTGTLNWHVGLRARWTTWGDFRSRAARSRQARTAMDTCDGHLVRHRADLYMIVSCSLAIKRRANPSLRRNGCIMICAKIYIKRVRALIPSAKLLVYSSARERVCVLQSPQIPGLVEASSRPAASRTSMNCTP